MKLNEMKPGDRFLYHDETTISEFDGLVFDVGNVKVVQGHHEQLGTFASPLCGGRPKWHDSTRDVCRLDHSAMVKCLELAV